MIVVLCEPLKSNLERILTKEKTVSAYSVFSSLFSRVIRGMFVFCSFPSPVSSVCLSPFPTFQSSTFYPFSFVKFVNYFCGIRSPVSVFRPFLPSNHPPFTLFHSCNSWIIFAVSDLRFPTFALSYLPTIHLLPFFHPCNS